jgi:hypothetical protein
MLTRNCQRLSVKWVRRSEGSRTHIALQSPSSFAATPGSTILFGCPTMSTGRSQPASMSSWSSRSTSILPLPGATTTSRPSQPVPVLPLSCCPWARLDLSWLHDVASYKHPLPLDAQQKIQIHLCPSAVVTSKSEDLVGKRDPLT